MLSLFFAGGFVNIRGGRCVEKKNFHYHPDIVVFYLFRLRDSRFIFIFTYLCMCSKNSIMTNSFLKLATEGNKNAILKQQIICQYILCGDSSITDLSKAVNLSVPTVTKLIGELIDEGFVHNFGEQGTAGGRRPNIYGLNPYAGYFIGVDIRKDSVVMAAINFKGQLIDETTVAFQMDNDPHSLDKLCEVILNFVRSHKITRDKVLGHRGEHLGPGEFADGIQLQLLFRRGAAAHDAA